MFKSVSLKLTIVSPTHIGSGKLFEDYRCLIDNSKFKYYSDNAIAGLITNNPEKIDVFSANILSSINALIKSNKSAITPEFTLESGSITEVKDIKRNIWDAITNKPYIPGTSLKGAIRTALDSSKTKSMSAIESPFKWLKVSDCNSTTENINSIGYFLGYKESKETNTKLRKDITSNQWCYEVPSQRRINVADYIKPGVEFDVAISINEAFGREVKGVTNFGELATKINSYYLSKFEQTVEDLSISTINKGKFVNSSYIENYKKIITLIKQNPQKTCIIHLGWHSEQLHHLLPELSAQAIKRSNNAHGHYAADRSVVQWMVSSSYSAKNQVPQDLQPIGWVVLSEDGIDSIGLSQAVTQASPVVVTRVDGQIAPELVEKFTKDGSLAKFDKLLSSAKVNLLEYIPEAKNHYLFNQLGALFAELMTRKLITDSWRKKIITFTSDEAVNYLTKLMNKGS